MKPERRWVVGSTRLICAECAYAYEEERMSNEEEDE